MPTIKNNNTCLYYNGRYCQNQNNYLVQVNNIYKSIQNN